MRAHMLIHNKDKVVMCKLCSAYLSNETALEQHMKNIHTRDYTCNICGKILKSRKTLLNHKNVNFFYIEMFILLCVCACMSRVCVRVRACVCVCKFTIYILFSFFFSRFKKYLLFLFFTGPCSC